MEEMRRLKRLQVQISKSKSAISDCEQVKGRQREYYAINKEYLKQINPTTKYNSSAGNISIHSGRSKLRVINSHGRHLSISRHSRISTRDNAHPMFEFAIALDAHGSIICPRSATYSGQLPSVKKSCNSVRSNKSARSTHSMSCKSTFIASKVSVSTSDYVSRCTHRRSLRV